MVGSERISIATDQQSGTITISAKRGSDVSIAIVVDPAKAVGFDYTNVTSPSDLPPETRRSFLSVLGESAQADLGEGLRNVEYFDVDHLLGDTSQSSIEFRLVDAKTLAGAPQMGEEVQFISLISPPYFIDDSKATKADKKGCLDLCADVEMADLFWFASQGKKQPSFCLRGPTYVWHAQYLNELDSKKKLRPRLQALLEAFIADNIPTAARHSRESIVHGLYQLTGYKNLNAITGLNCETPREPPNFPLEECVPMAAVIHAPIRAGMGVVIQTELAGAMEYVVGYVVDMRPPESLAGGTVGTGDDARASWDIQYRLLIMQSQIPSFMICKIGENEVLQTNIILSAKHHQVVGTLSVVHHSMFHPGCDRMSADMKAKRAKLCPLRRDKSVIGHLEVLEYLIKQPETQKVHVGLPSSLEAVAKVLAESPEQVQIWRVKPLDPNLCLSALYWGGIIFGPTKAEIYCEQLGFNLRNYAWQVAGHLNKMTGRANTFQVVGVPGRVLMHGLYENILNDSDYKVQVNGGTMSVTVCNVESLKRTFGCEFASGSIKGYEKSLVFNFTSLGKGFVCFSAPFVFKWKMWSRKGGPRSSFCPTDGSVSVEVHSWTELDRMKQWAKSSERL